MNVTATQALCVPCPKCHAGRESACLSPTGEPVGPHNARRRSAARGWEQLAFDFVPPEPKGETFDAERDGPRLAAQSRRVVEAMGDTEWHTLRELAEITGDPEASISARIRGLRDYWRVEREYVANGLHRYRIAGALPPEERNAK